MGYMIRWQSCSPSGANILGCDNALTNTRIAAEQKQPADAQYSGSLKTRLNGAADAGRYASEERVIGTHRYNGERRAGEADVVDAGYGGRGCRRHDAALWLSRL